MAKGELTITTVSGGLSYLGDGSEWIAGVPITTVSGGLSYLGDGSEWIAGVPARDLTADECLALDVEALIASGLYRPPFMQFAPSVSTTGNTPTEV